MIEKEIKGKIEEMVYKHINLGPGSKMVKRVADDIFRTLNKEGIMRITKQKLLKMEMLVVVNDDFEDMSHEVHDAMKKIECVEGVVATRVIRTIPMDDEFDEMPLYDSGAIWEEMGQE